MNLEKKIAELRADVQSDRLSMSIGELAGLYERNELDVHPKFQRILRWSNAQKTRLIESILLRIPIPPIFVAQAQNGSWDVVDGVQRLGTIFEFRGRGSFGWQRRREGAVLVPRRQMDLLFRRRTNQENCSHGWGGTNHRQTRWPVQQRCLGQGRDPFQTPKPFPYLQDSRGRREA